ncbi:hypothetical protein GCM10009737_00470 [Nocardioides lentus]|uniref:Putative T7SS secretion signal domain-containing protein n=1 Tax=Nocardioides lentus TaxID=338077 RepID=A0ABN2NUS2_9ACTN
MEVKELGETEDPTQLVPGEPGQVRTAATAFGDEGRHMNAVHDTLAGVSVPQWEGLAADAFDATYRSSVRPWADIADDLLEVETKLGDHAGVLSSAQDKARRAIAKWREGEQATQQALTAHNDAVATYNAALDRPVPTIGGAGPASLPPRPGIFLDPGVALRQEAQELLAEAREDVVTSAETAGESVGRLPGAMTGPGGEDDEGGFGDTTTTVSENEADPTWSWEGGWGDGAAQNTDTDGDGVTDDVDPDLDGDGLTDVDDSDVQSDATEPGEDDDGLGVSVDLGSVEAGDSVYGAEGSVTDQYGPVTANAQGGVHGIGYEAEAGMTLGEDGLQANAGAAGYLAQAEGSASLAAGPVEIGVEGNAMVGVEAGVDAGIGPDGVHAGGEAFVGARGEIGASGEVGGVGVAGTAEGWVGAGVEADVNVGMNEDGSFTIGGSFGAALGIGGSLSGEITIDPGEVVDTVQDIGDGIGDGVDAIGDGLSDAGDAMGDALGSIF